MEHLYKDYLTICAIIKDEARYIEEWIVFHRLVGVERFYIYDNNSSDHVKDLLKPYIQKGIVVYQEWPKHPGQVEAYNHFLENFGAASTWVAFIDVDEFLFGTKEDDLRNILNGYKDYSGVCVNWVCFGSSGHIKKPEGLVIENFTTRPSLDFNDNRHVKCIVQPQKVLRALSPHIFVFLDVNSPVTEEGSRIKPSPENLEGALSEKCSIGIMRINHYIIKSKEECEVKLKRTRATMISNDRGKDYFLHFDKNSQKDEEILRFLPQLKKNLETKRDYLAICAIVKNEALYIEEWIEFHRLVGVERFYIYDNNSSDHGKDLLKPYIQKGIVVYQEWPKQRGQVEAYNHFLENFGAASTWVAFIDVDEFLFGTLEDDLRNILKGYKDYSGVCVNWVCFGSSGHIKRPKGLVVENFIRRPRFDFGDNRHVKCIVQPQKIIRALSPHIFLYLNDDWPVIEDGSRIVPGPENLQGALSEKCSTGTIRINHYIIKSKEECEAKLNSIMAAQAGKTLASDYFLHFDKNIEKDEEILRFLPRLKERFEFKKPGSVMPVAFDWEQYVANYPDLQLAGVKTKEMAEAHWMKYGYFENRNYRNLIYDRYLKLNNKNCKEDVTVIIPIKNRVDYRLPNALKSIRHQDYDKELIDILVIDYDSCSELIGSLNEICQNYAARYIRIEDRPVWSRSRCLNIGIRQAKTKYILLTDVDIIFEMNYITQAVKELQNNPCKIIRCTSRNSNNIDIDDKTDIIRDYQIIKDKAIFIHKIANHDKNAYGKGIIFILIEFLKQVGGLDEFYSGWGFEDEDLVKRLELMGLRSVNIDEKTSYVHQWHPKYEGLKDQEKRIEENREYYISTNTIIRNKESWGAI